MNEYRLTSEDQEEILQRFAVYQSMPVKHDLEPDEREALDRLIMIAMRDSGQSRIVADFLLSWWNSSECGSFGPTKLWGLDREIGDDVCLIFRAIASMAKYPDALGYEEQFSRLVRIWRPQLFESDAAGVGGAQLSI